MPHKPQLLHRCPHFQCSLTQSNFNSNNNKIHSFLNWFLSTLQQRYCLISNNIQFTSVLRVYEIHLPFKCNTQVPLNQPFTHPFNSYFTFYVRPLFASRVTKQTNKQTKLVRQSPWPQRYNRILQEVDKQFQCHRISTLIIEREHQDTMGA